MCGIFSRRRDKGVTRERLTSACVMAGAAREMAATRRAAPWHLRIASKRRRRRNSKSSSYSRNAGGALRASSSASASRAVTRARRFSSPQAATRLKATPGMVFCGAAISGMPRAFKKIVRGTNGDVGRGENRGWRRQENCAVCERRRDKQSG